MEDIFEFQNSCMHLVIDESAKLMYSEWVRKPTNEEYREAATIFAKYLREKNIEYWIQDANKLGAVPASELKWVLQELIPAAASTALKKVARIMSDDKDAEEFIYMVQQAQAEFKTDFKVQQFKTYREAAEWIEGQS